MPNKMIYVSEEDLPVLEKAQELAGTSLSATMIEALKRLIDNEKVSAESFEEIQLKLGEDGTYAHKRFFGKELGRTKTVDKERRSTIWIVYKTAKHQLALYKKEIFDSSLNELMRTKIAETLEGDFDLDIELSANSPEKSPKYTLEVFETMDKIVEYIPEKLAKLLLFGYSENGETDDFLDI